MKQVYTFLTLATLVLSFNMQAQITVEENVTVDTRNINDIQIEETEEQVATIYCYAFLYNGQGSTVTDIGSKSSACDEPFKEKMRSLVKKRKAKWVYFQEHVTLKHHISLNILMEDGTVHTIGPVAESRPQGKTVYENKHKLAEIQIKEAIKNGQKDFYNQHGLCYREVISISPAKADFLISIKRLKIDCKSVPSETLEFRKD